MKRVPSWKHESRRDQVVCQEMEKEGMGVQIIHLIRFKTHATEPRRLMAAGAGRKS